MVNKDYASKRRVYFDFETRSGLDLKDFGTDNYARHETTEPICLAWARGDENVQIWRPLEGEPFPVQTFLEFFNDDNLIFSAWNANFEIQLWNKCLRRRVPQLPVLELDKIACSMVESYAMGLPGALENAAFALNIDIKKDMAGNRVMLQLAQPRETIVRRLPNQLDKSETKYVFWDKRAAKDEKDLAVITEKLNAVYSYCKTDVEVERKISKLLFPLSPSERELWILDQRINERGVPVNVELAKRAGAIVEAEQFNLMKSLQQLTQNQVDSGRAVSQLKTWLLNECGLQLESLDKATVVELLDEDGLFFNSILTDNAKKVLAIRQMASKSSTAKFTKMVTASSIHDSRFRNALQFNGAHTGRWTGRGLQLHNLPRPKLKQKEIEEVFSALEGVPFAEKQPNLAIEMFKVLELEPIIPSLSDCLRGFLEAKLNTVFTALDWNAIEARVLAWAAGQENVLNLFRQGKDVYLNQASGIYYLPENEITELQRLVGKVATLALGYQGGATAFELMAKNYGLKVTKKAAEEIKTGFRESNPKIVQYWADVKAAAMNAVLYPKTPFKAGALGREVTFKTAGSFLFCQLPSKRVLVYPFPKIERVTPPWVPKEKRVNKEDGAEAVLESDKIEAITYRTMENGNWVRTSTHGGVLVENIVQALARDVLKDALLRFYNFGYNKNLGAEVVLHVHDEVVFEGTDLGDAGNLERLKILGDLMSQSPIWGPDLPLKAGGWVGRRYRK